MNAFVSFSFVVCLLLGIYRPLGKDATAVLNGCLLGVVVTISLVSVPVEDKSVAQLRSIHLEHIGYSLALTFFIMPLAWLYFVNWGQDLRNPLFKMSWLTTFSIFSLLYSMWQWCEFADKCKKDKQSGAEDDTAMLEKPEDPSGEAEPPK